MKENEPKAIGFQAVLPGFESRLPVVKPGLEEGWFVEVTQEIDEEISEESTDLESQNEPASQSEFANLFFKIIKSPALRTLLEITKQDPVVPEQKRRMDVLINGLREGNFQK